MATETQSTDGPVWIVHLHSGVVLRVEATTWELKLVDDFYYFTNGGSSCAAAISRGSVAAIVDESAVTVRRPS